MYLQLPTWPVLYLYTGAIAFILAAFLMPICTKLLRRFNVMDQPSDGSEYIDGEMVPRFGPTVQNAHTGFPKDVIAALEAYENDRSCVVGEMLNPSYRQWRYLWLPKEP